MIIEKIENVIITVVPKKGRRGQIADTELIQAI